MNSHLHRHVAHRRLGISVALPSNEVWTRFFGGQIKLAHPTMGKFKHLLPSMGLVVSVLLTACTVGPDYRAPNPSVPDRWVEQPKSAAQSQQDFSKWWRGFNDERLNRLIERALLGNLDLQIAQSRIQAARAQVTVAESQFWPSVNASGGYQRQRISPNALRGALGSFLGGSNSTGLLSTLGPIGKPFNLFQAGFDSSWELDLFGGLRRQEEAAAAQAEASEESLRDLRVSLTAEVARQYLELAALHRQLAVARERLADAHALERLVTASFQEGLATDIDLRQAKTARETADSAIAPLEAQIKSTHHALAFLLGLEPGALDRQLAGVADIPEPPAIKPGLPADLLRRRPDIRQAERQVAAASASIGAAVAELFPKLSLTGVAGLQSQDLSNFTSLSSGFYGFGPPPFPAHFRGRASAGQHRCTGSRASGGAGGLSKIRASRAEGSGRRLGAGQGRTGASQGLGCGRAGEPESIPRRDGLLRRRGNRLGPSARQAPGLARCPRPADSEPVGLDHGPRRPVQGLGGRLVSFSGDTWP